jgi:hypothetical protein
LIPHLSIQFDLKLEFGDGLFVFDVSGTPVGSMDEKNADISEPEYTLVATMHQDILTYLERKVTEVFDQLAKEDQQKADAEEAAIDAARKKEDEDIQSKQDHLNACFASWKAKSD